MCQNQWLKITTLLWQYADKQTYVHDMNAMDSTQLRIVRNPSRHCIIFPIKQIVWNSLIFITEATAVTKHRNILVILLSNHNSSSTSNINLKQFTFFIFFNSLHFYSDNSWTLLNTNQGLFSGIHMVAF